MAVEETNWKKLNFNKQPRTKFQFKVIYIQIKQIFSPVTHSIFNGIFRTNRDAELQNNAAIAISNVGTIWTMASSRNNSKL